MKAVSPPLSSPQGLLRGLFAILAALLIVFLIVFLSVAPVPAFAQNPTGVTPSAEPSSEAASNGVPPIPRAAQRCSSSTLLAQ